MTNDMHQVASRDLPDFLTVRDLAALLRVSTTTVYRLVEQRRLPYYKPTGLLRFAREDVLRHLQDVRVASCNEHQHERTQNPQLMVG